MEVHSLWGCVLNELGDPCPAPEVLPNTIRVTSVSIQSLVGNSSVNCDIFALVSINQSKPLQVAHLSDEQRQAHLDVVLKQGDQVAFYKRTVPSVKKGSYVVQFMGHCMDEHSASRVQVEKLQKDIEGLRLDLNGLRKSVEELADVKPMIQM